ncbi:sugar efflux transporter for intercellular exchange-domain-containing protein [Dunaliella salina]|uniref:Sugar efflux transporter for intercellular exchange-domain-containing protein n=1 Tax=Dunaliella salina TaxID=3046 RepID=A0ABQ7GTE4_DUNSA|nr:sugar efflux transporter for intercellular exchange-domain-containing protein [Dunaliella salina]|eukprot:KAF5837855.1 sugar efflux transporter for intercellular exchange-domain-containing protein [Dunaliella salina]
MRHRIVANCVVWLLYAAYVKAPYVAAGNLPGLVLGVYMTFIAYGVADLKTRDSMVRVVVVITTVLSLGPTAVALFVKDTALGANAIGYLAVGILLCYYSAPLSALAAVVQSRTSASLHAPLSLMSFINGALWVSYGLAVGDAFIWGPNGVGALFGAIQLILLAIFPKSSSNQERISAQDEVERAPLRQSPQ